jgi:hypothetical protein
MLFNCLEGVGEGEGDEKTTANTLSILLTSTIFLSAKSNLSEIIRNCLFSKNISSRNLGDDGISFANGLVEDERDELIRAKRE